MNALIRIITRMLPIMHHHPIGKGNKDGFSPRITSFNPDKSGSFDEAESENTESSKNKFNLKNIREGLLGKKKQLLKDILLLWIKEDNQYLGFLLIQ